MNNLFNISNPEYYKVALYIRLSKEDLKPGESESISNQRALLKTFTDDYNLTVYNEYIDDGISGTTFDRPSFKNLSRLGRDYILTGYYLEKFFPEHKVRYIALLDGIDTESDNSNNDITPFRAVFNDMYAKDISNKIKSVKRNKQDLGLFIGGKAPFGYKLNKKIPNKLFIDKEAKPIIKQIFYQASLRIFM